MRTLLATLAVAGLIIVIAGTTVAKPVVYETTIWDGKPGVAEVGTARITVLPNGQWRLRAKLDGAVPNTTLDAHFSHDNLTADDTVTTNAKGKATWNVRLGTWDPDAMQTLVSVVTFTADEPGEDPVSYRGLFELP